MATTIERLREILTAPQDRKQKPAPEPISEARRTEIQAQIDAVLAERNTSRRSFNSTSATSTIESPRQLKSKSQKPEMRFK